MCAADPAQLDTAIARRIRARRRHLGLTQAAVAASIGVRFQQIQKYEAGQNRPYLSTAMRLASALGWTACQLVDGLGEAS